MPTLDVAPPHLKGADIELRLAWDKCRQTLAKGASGGLDSGVTVVDEDAVYSDDSSDALDPTQRALADRVLAWGAELAKNYEVVRKTGCCKALPLLRTWLGGSAGSGKSTTLRTLCNICGSCS